MITRLVVAGASGQVGRRILAAARWPALGTSSRDVPGMLRLDLAEPERFDYASLTANDVVVLAAGLSSPDACARHPERAAAVNVLGTARFMERALERDARVVFLSSDTVLGEPVAPYARMKREIEARFASHPRVRAVRLSYVFSREDPFTAYLAACAARGAEADIFHPFYRALVHREDVVEGILALAERWNEFAQPAINFGGPQLLSRVEIVETLQRLALPQLRWRAVEPPPDFFRNRPRSIAMSSPLLPLLLGRPARPLHEAIALEFSGK
ncbi:MAG: NAD-dependent epimerase/dehydratase family protein [Betaproteobacteria bacterium]